jgi:hypothetical protein
VNAARKSKAHLSEAKPYATESPREVDQQAVTEIDCVERLTPRFEVELPKGVECCCLFDGSIVKTLYLSPRRGRRGTQSRM